MLDIAAISKRFGTRQALADVTFTVRPGEVFGFVGSNGVGKSTTMRIVLGVLTADAGEVRFEGHPVDLGPAAGSATCRRSAGCTRG